MLQEPLDALEMINDLGLTEREKEDAAVLYLLGNALNNFSSRASRFMNDNMEQFIDVRTYIQHYCVYY